MSDAKFDPFTLMHKLLEKRIKLEETLEAISQAERSAVELQAETSELEAVLAASFEASGITAVTHNHRYKNYAVILVDGSLRISEIGSVFSLTEPERHSYSVPMVTDDQITEAAVHAAIQDFGELESDSDAAFYEVLRSTAG